MQVRRALTVKPKAKETPSGGIRVIPKREIPWELKLENYCKDRITPIDGNDPEVYSEKIQYHFPHSFICPSGNPADVVKKKKKMPPPPTFQTQEEMQKMDLTDIMEVFKDWTIMQDGSLKLSNKEIISKQSSAMFDMFKKMAKSVFNSDILGLSLPASMNEPRSMTERMCNFYRMFAQYIWRASTIHDKLERFKLMIAGSIGSFILDCSSEKPFNPILGETFQAGYEDGTLFYAEQTSHHPATCHTYIVGPNNSYTDSAHFSAFGKFTPNTMKMIMEGSEKLVFKDGYWIKTGSFPIFKISGFLSGDMRFRLKGPYEFEDSDGIKAVVFFDHGAKEGLIWKKKVFPKDSIEGIIYLPDRNAPKLKKKPKRIEDLNDVKTELSRISGSWLKNIDINGVNYWNIQKMQLQEMRFQGNPIPSDVRFREDIIWLKRGKVVFADSWKDAIEIRQRADAKLRSAAAKKLAKEKKSQL
eukprot:TRINITY_DN17641_c0_g1_i2.p1 TRINITY_DN17641_c0_g1~~TRINITY_DN17641_c0_g1_i2.p1  ORF type:complete len:471 (-),score=71.03 TRINITY_DN17641_c0_g1_i2:52-1464(-)